MASLGPADPFQHPAADLDLRTPGQSAFEMADSVRTRLFRGRVEARSWRVGGEGEQVVARHLRRLEEPDWLVLHDLTLSAGGANVDHLVVGPPGVFSINTKHHRDSKVWVGSRMVMINGFKKREYLDKAKAEAKRVQAGIAAHSEVPFTVTPVLAFVCTEMKVKQEPADVLVARGSELARRLGRMDRTLDGSQLWRLKHDVAAWAKTLERFQKAS